MKTVGLAAFGWLVPGGAYLLMRRYGRFVVFAILVSATFAAGLALHGTLQWPQPADLQGLDSLPVWIFKAGALAKLLAGCPYLLALLAGSPAGFLDGRLHEYGTTLLMLAGLFNLLAVSTALELRKGGTLVPHLEFTLLLALLLSTVMALLGDRSLRERCYVATYIFICCTAAAVAGSWGMYLIHG